MRLQSGAALVALFAGLSLAHPTPSTTSHSSHKQPVGLSAYLLKSEGTYRTVGNVSDLNLKLRHRSTDSLWFYDKAITYVQHLYQKAEFRLLPDHYFGLNQIGHVYFKQTHNSIVIENVDISVNFDKNGDIFSWTGEFLEDVDSLVAKITTRAHVGPLEALQGVLSQLSLPVITESATTTSAMEGDTEHYVINGASGTHQDPKARLVYFSNPNNTLSLAWRIEVDIRTHWLVSYVDAYEPTNIFGVVNYASHASYTVFPWTVANPDQGERTVEVDPWDSFASKSTWQEASKNLSATTRGNNGIAQANFDGGDDYETSYRPVVGNSSFDFPLDLSADDPKTYADASITQLWYTTNMCHDLYYLLGFTEAAGNFQASNGLLGGQGNDFVILDTQDSSDLNNAQFMTPPDGQNPRMQMFLFNDTVPARDSSFDTGIVIHEYTHGVTNRLTGGPLNDMCLSSDEPLGMGEGWGDFFAVAVLLKHTATRDVNVPVGEWVSNDPNGFRKYLYSTSLKTNPLTYESVNTMDEEHSIGAVWASILYEVLWNMIEIYGITDGTRPDTVAGTATDGRFLTMQLVVDGLALQPCRPNFITGRDAIIDSDKLRTGGVNACPLWKGFAKRGLGVGAERGDVSGSNRVESFDVPVGVC